MAFAKALTTILVKNKIFSQEEADSLQKAFKESSKPSFDYFLLEEGLIQKEDLLKALSEHYQVPYFDASGFFFQTFLLKKFPKDFLLRNGIIPIQQDGNMLMMLASSPENPELLPKIGEHVSYDIRFRVGLMRDIIDAIQTYYEPSVTE